MNPARFSSTLLCMLFTGSLFLTALAQKIDLEMLNNCSTDLEIDLFGQWNREDPRPDNLLCALLVAEGVTDSLEISNFVKQFELLKTGLDKKIKHKHSPEKKSSIIFKYLHKEQFKKYTQNAQLAASFLSHEYNCLTATIFFYLLADHYNLATQIYTTPNHVFLVVETGKKPVTIELTDPVKGFDYEGNHQQYIDYLLKYKLITSEELAEKGTDQIYTEYIDKRRAISPAQLPALMYNNRSLSYVEKKKYAETLCMLRKAIFIDPEYQPFVELYKLTLLQMLLEVNQDLSPYLDELELALVIFDGDLEIQKTTWDLFKSHIQKLAVYDKAFQKSTEIVERLKSRFAKDSTYAARIEELDKIILISWSQALYLRGEYNRAYDKIKTLYAISPEEKLYQDAYVDITVNYARQLVQYGKVERSLSMLDSLAVLFPDYPVVKDAYVNLLMMHIYNSNASDKDTDQLFRYLQRAYTVDPQNQIVKNLLLMAYHEMAMEKVRENKYLAARNIAVDGLDIDQDFQLLLDDIEQIDNVIVRQRLNRKK